MAKTKKDTRILSIVVNAVIVLWMAYCMYRMFSYGLEGNMGGSKWSCFRYYTIDSNFLAAVSALVMLIDRIFSGQPKSFSTHLKYYGTCTVAVTFATVMAFLGPMMGYNRMFTGDNLYMHLIGPVLCIISFCFLDKGPKLSRGHVFKSLIPTAIYGAVYFVMVMITKDWPDVYGFNAMGKWYISVVAMAAGAFVIAVILKALHNDK